MTTPVFQRISSPATSIKKHYDVVVIGSGYGGSIAASRMARAGMTVCLLERGKELIPGEYPKRYLEAAEEIQVDLPGEHIGSKTAMVDFRVNNDINVVLGCGLGGTSLINANVSLKPDPRLFDDPRWPKEIRNDIDSLHRNMDRALAMLDPKPYPDGSDGYPKLPKLEALKKSASHLNAPCYAPPINVTFKDGPNAAGVQQYACVNCGDCVTGCNYGAKNTTLMNYLPDAKNFGAEIFTEVAVKYVSRVGSKWVIHYQLQHSGGGKFDEPELFVTADICVISAGTLGSTEILLRSKENGLALSDQLGAHFTGNGDVLGFSFNNDQEINGIGFGHHEPGTKVDPVGPTITGVIDMRNVSPVEEGMVIEEGAVPGAISTTLIEAFIPLARIAGKNMDAPGEKLFPEEKRELISFLEGPYKGAINNTQTFLVMTHEDAKGKMYLKEDRLRIDWPSVGSQPIFNKVDEKLKLATEATSGTYVPSPMWNKLMDYDLITVHPLGGCVMGEDAASGVVNYKGQVFEGETGDSIYRGLYVADGSIIPRPLGVNPLVTISGLSEMICEGIAKEYSKTISYEKKVFNIKSDERKLGVAFTEKMKGFFSVNEKTDYAKGFTQGKLDNSSFEFILTIASNNLEDMLRNNQHQAFMTGIVNAPALSDKPLTVHHGIFNLFVDDHDNVRTKKMNYKMQMDTVDGKTFYCYGYKEVKDDKGWDVWIDTTTLFITIYDGENEQAPVLGKGKLFILPDDFRKQMSTMRVLNASSNSEKVNALSRFGKYFSGVLFDTYGGIASGLHYFNKDATAREKRTLSVSAPEIYYFKTSDNVELRLTRYQGGNKGPVMLSHGLGVSSKIFSLDTIEVNLLEYLYANKYDVWLLDFRASIDLPASLSSFTGDDIATKDYPAAIAKIVEVTGAKDVQCVVHCFGATTFGLALLSGLKGVRSAVFSQIGTHSIVPFMQKIKIGLHAPELLDALGVESLSAYTDTHSDWMDKLYDKALKLYPVGHEEQCTSPVCHRITFMYSLLYEHDQLNSPTHETLHELFGIANMRSLEHLATMIRKGHSVNSSGDDVYMPHMDRMALPITFIHGEENQCFLPKSTEKTFNLLREKNPGIPYQRHVIPGYGHIDCIFGKNASRDVYPYILEHLEKY